MVRYILSYLALVGLIAAPAAAAASECPRSEPIRSDEVEEVALAVWEIESASKRWEDARDAVSGRFESLELGAAQEFAPGDLPAETTADAGITIALGNLAELRRERMAARAQQDRTSLNADAFEFALRVRRAYATWWAAEVERSHLEEYLIEAREEAQPLLEGAESGMVSRVDIADVRAEIARIEGELITARSRSEAAFNGLRGALGSSCDFVSPSEVSMARDNGWDELSQRANQLPAVAEIRAEARKMRADAEVLREGEPWRIGVGASLRMESFGPFVLGPSLSLTIPLAQPDRSEAFASDIEASRLERSADRLLRRLDAEFKGRAASHRARQEAVADWKEKVVSPLQKRVELFEEAHRAGQLSTFRLIDARRQLHESQHQLLLLQLDVAIDSLEARGTQNLLERLSLGDQP